MSAASASRTGLGPDFINLQEAGQLLGVDPRVVRRHIVTGALPAIRIGRRFRIRRLDLYRFAMAHLVRPEGVSV